MTWHGSPNSRFRLTMRGRLPYISVLMMIIIGLGCGSVMGQEGEGGLESPFAIGFGARALGMGSASVAYPADPSAFFWNPAGMVVIEQKTVGLSATTLFEGTQYNFIGYVHPTMTTGTFGVGIVRIGTGGIGQRHWDMGTIVEEGDISYWWGKLVLAYAIPVYNGLSVGLNLDVNRQVLGTYSTNGFNLDLGIHYHCPYEHWLVRNLYVGCKVRNALRPRLKLGAFSETLPYNIRAGIAKVFFLRRNLDRWILLADYDKSQHTKGRYHVGMEYGWNSMIYLRAGIDNGEMTFGGGLRFMNFQLDYGSSRIADPDYFSRSHRFTLMFYFGRSIPERKEMIEEQRRLEIQRRFDERIEAERDRRVSEGLRAGREYLESEDYFNARLEFSRVLREDENNEQARALLTETTEREQELQRTREEQLLQQAREKDQQRRDNTFISLRYQEGLSAFEELDFQGAIEQWEQALERDPENDQIRSYVERARVELENEVNRLLARSEQLVRQENISEAYKVLTRAKEQTVGHPELRNQVQREIERLDRIVDFLTNYQEGQQRYSNQDYEAAVRFFQKALEYFPSHERAREFYRNSLARARGQKRPMEGQVKEKYNEGIRLFRDGQYEEALRVWEEALELDPNNIYIMDAIEGAREKLKLYNREEE